ncbi:UNVERIFIED_CONTAM: putative mitochondrial protein [Sesamum radiatum]|uniref:Mitochondrial protein n=1 Tax=Sesamum radiatum TaxID=300843 RepID=A0AAW2W6Z9_SESRA
MASFKSPDPDGFPPSFFKQFWHIVGRQVIDATLYFFSNGQILPAINHTYITLIPKGPNARTVEQFRPISLCNTTYKVISKILANRLKPLLDKLISPFQMAFVPGRTINDNSILSHEIIHYLQQKKGKKGFMAIKIDLTKAYDKVEWTVLCQIQRKVGICEEFVNRISLCISSPSFSLLINGSPFGYFRPTRGIRQGDPLSPYLFILYAEILSRLILHEKSLGNIKGVKTKRASWIWQDAVKCIQVTQLGLCFPVSTCSELRIYEDPWVPTIPKFIPEPRGEINQTWPTLVHDLIEGSTFSWKLDLLTQMFPDEVVKEIKKIKIPTLMESPKPFWAPSKSEAAFFAIQCQSLFVDEESEIIGKRIWKLDLHNRLKLLIWRILFDLLPTRGKLNQVFQIQNTECPLCQFQVENSHHIFMCCPLSKKVWMLSKWQVRLFSLSHLQLREWFLIITDPKTNFFPDWSIQQEFITTWAVTLELIWRARNDLIHGKGEPNPKEIAKAIQWKAADHCNARGARKAKEQTNCEWMPPPPGFVKINTDILLKDDKCFAALIIRNHQGALFFAESTENFCYNPSSAELRAIRMASEKLHLNNFEKVILESDSAESIKWIKSNVEEVDRIARLDVQEIKRIWEARPKWDFKKILRLCNGLAHGVAKWAHGANWDGPIPPPIFPKDVFCDKGPTTLELFCDL